MSILQPLIIADNNIPTVEKLPPPVTCENPSCQKVVPVRHDAINVIVQIGSPGHPSLPAFQCPIVEHWACSIECWSVIAHACINEHIIPVLQAYRASVGLDQHAG